MFLDIYNNNGIRHIRISESYRIEKDGKRVARKRTVANIGAVSKFDDGKPDFEQRLRDSFKAGTPLIEELKPYVKKEIPKEVVHLDVHFGTDECVGHPKYFASSLFDGIVDKIGLRTFVGSYKNYDGVNFDVLGFLKLIVYGRILNPQSKIATVKQNEKYYTPVIKDEFYEYNVYDMLDFVYRHKNAIFNRIDGNMRKYYGRTTNKIYYDVTNFFFESDQADKYEDENDETVYTGLRQYGVSKEERKLPIVQMGLLMDEQGYPVSIETFRGNTLDHLTLKKSFENAPEETSESRYIFVSDKGIGMGGNMKFAVAGGNGYVVSKSVRGSTKEDKDWMCCDDGYVSNADGTFKIKSRIYVKKFKLEDGTELKSSEKEVVYWSKKFYDKEYNEKKHYYDFLKKLIETPDNFKITKIEASQVGRYIKKKLVNEKTGELIDSKDLKAILDMEKLEKEFRLLGYYSIITSETEMTDEKVIATYHNLVKIEDEFRVLKMSFETRPIYVRKPEHITSHLVLCTIALLIIRIIQNRIKLQNPADFPDNSAMSVERIREALTTWTVEKFADEYYRFNDTDNPDLQIILSSFGIDIQKKLYLLGELKHIKQTIELCQ